MRSILGMITKRNALIIIWWNLISVCHKSDCPSDSCFDWDFLLGFLHIFFIQCELLVEQNETCRNSYRVQWHWLFDWWFWWLHLMSQMMFATRPIQPTILRQLDSFSSILTIVGHHVPNQPTRTYRCHPMVNKNIVVCIQAFWIKGQFNGSVYLQCTTRTQAK